MKIWLVSIILPTWLAGCLIHEPPGPIYLGMTTGHFLRAGCLGEPKRVTSVEDVTVYDCSRPKGRYSVEIRAGAIVTIHSPDGQDLRRAN